MAQPPAGGALAARAPAGRQRVDRHARHRRRRARGHRRQRPGASRSATACSPTASRSTSTTSAEREAAEVAEEFMLQYYAGAISIPAADRRPARERRRWREALADAPRRTRRAARRRARRQAPPARPRRAQRAARARPGEAQGRAPPPAARRGARRPAAGARARRAAAAHRVLRHLDADGHEHDGVDGRLRGRRAEEVRLPPLQRPRPSGGRARRLRRDGGGARPAAGAVGGPAGPRPARPQAQRVVRRRCRTSSSSTAARASSRPACARSHGFRERGVAVISLAKRARGGLHRRAPSAPIVLAHDTPELQLLQRVRDEAHRFAITHHRSAPRQAR